MNTKKRIKQLEEAILALEAQATPKDYSRMLNDYIELNSESINVQSNRIDSLTNRIEALEHHIVEPNKMIEDETLVKKNAKNLNSDDAKLSEVKQQVIELLNKTELPDWAVWIAVDENGKTWVYKKLKPFIYKTIFVTIWKNGMNAKHLDYINLNGADWTKCLWMISDLLNKQNQPKSDEDLSQNKGNEQPDLENLLSVGDLEEIKRSAIKASFKSENINLTSNNIQIDLLNKLINKRIKPLLDSYKLCKIERDNYYDELHEARQRIAQLEALNKTYETSALSSLVEIPFQLDSADDIIFDFDNNPYKTCSIWKYCRNNNINQNQIKRILLEMKSEEK